VACADFLLTDIKMPNMNGLEFIERQMESSCKAGFRNKAVMSAVWSEEDLLKAEQLGCKVFHKPFSLEEILDWLEEGKCWLDENRQLATL
jgi:CheY-like chemotaxis protein